MSYFVLTHRLHKRLHAAAPSRVVNTASAAHLRATLDFDDLQEHKDLPGRRCLWPLQLCNILFTREHACGRRASGSPDLFSTTRQNVIVSAR
jgi:hypothetical protein